MRAMFRNEIETRIFEFLFFMAAPIVGQKSLPCYCVPKINLYRREPCFPIFEHSFQESRGLLPAAFYGSGHNHVRLPVHCWATISPSFPQLLWFIDVLALVQSSYSQPFHSHEVSCCFLFFCPFFFLAVKNSAMPKIKYLHFFCDYIN